MNMMRFFFCVFFLLLVLFPLPLCVVVPVQSYKHHVVCMVMPTELYWWLMYLLCVVMHGIENNNSDKESKQRSICKNT